MSTNTVEKAATSVVGNAKKLVASRTVFIKANRPGVVPLERRDANGEPIVSTCEYSPQGKMMKVKHERPLVFAKNHVQAINPLDAADKKFLNEVREWLAVGDDPRIKTYGITIIEGGNGEGVPLTRYDLYKPEALVKRLTEEVDLIADDPEAVRAFLESCARYELQRTHPEGHKNAGKSATRQKVLEAIEDLGIASGVEYGTDEVDEL